jgi:alkanesulfonate monooxygenase SsuD/methylene tetrahydromethanopterin reductase-like flavin-dependent oxidoreductase (luciferase family)
VDEVRAGEAMGLGHAFISERGNVKEAATLSGAAGAVSERLGIATAATNHNTRHPAVTAFMHGASPDELAPVVAAYRARRPAGRFDDLAGQPGDGAGAVTA